jgi:EAL domain-containing protein (putative c-di-GMP-specific phosphodiesterase class I)
VLRQACRWATFIGVERGLPVSVNLSPRQFNDPKLVHTVAAALRETGLPARLLQLEITETTAMQHTDVTLATLNRLKALGVSIAIDDFGTGYSSLSYLKRFPVDLLKIDRSFTAELPADADQCAIVSAIVALAHALELQVIAEGVENAEQRAFLASCGCDFIQGHLTGAPLDADAASKDFV